MEPPPVWDDSIIREYYAKHTIEEDIAVVLQYLSEVDESTKLPKLSYEALEIAKKLKPKTPYIFKKSIEDNVVMYYLTINDQLLELEKDYFGVSDMIAQEVKRCYTEFFYRGFSQSEIYNSLVEWLNKRTLNRFPYAVDIVISVMQQTC